MATIRIWPDGVPGGSWSPRPESSQTMEELATGSALAVTDVSEPTLTRFDPEPGRAHGGAVLVLPGGAFRFLVVDKEGSEIADWFTQRGYVAFVLKYRVRGSDPMELFQALARRDWGRAMELMEDGRTVAAADAARAIAHLRQHADELGIDRNRVGMIGFSAGAIATMDACLNEDAGNRPDFAMPIYGAMSELPVPQDAPPLFLVHAFDDAVVPMEETLRIASAWRSADRSAELHVYDKGGHGFAMRRLGLPVDHWPDSLDRWLVRHGFGDPA